MTRQPDLPDLGSGRAFEHALLARAFHLLLEDGQPVSGARLAQALACDADWVEQGLVRLDREGRIRRDRTGAVTGSHGLSVTPTPHELILDRRSGQERRFWTWCAWDAVGILAALGASGRIRSSSPGSGVRIRLDFDHGQPRNPEPGLVVFIADTDCGSVVDDWCPMVNFFEHAEAAQAWADEHRVRGTAAPLAQATDQGKVAWRRWIVDQDHGQPADKAGQA